MQPCRKSEWVRVFVVLDLCNQSIPELAIWTSFILQFRVRNRAGAGDDLRGDRDLTLSWSSCSGLGCIAH
jgi:hypothetical protein